ncbi:High-affinity choline uptake protein BetT [Actinomycetales bacterium JB111]|nr:High-affinity choline uptake protein BetT [Actinomycetales bacterium JB111]
MDRHDGVRRVAPERAGHDHTVSDRHRVDVDRRIQRVARVVVGRSVVVLVDVQLGVDHVDHGVLVAVHAGAQRGLLTHVQDEDGRVALGDRHRGVGGNADDERAGVDLELDARLGAVDVVDDELVVARIHDPRAGRVQVGLEEAEDRHEAVRVLAAERAGVVGRLELEVGVVGGVPAEDDRRTLLDVQRDADLSPGLDTRLPGGADDLTVGVREVRGAGLLVTDHLADGDGRLGRRLLLGGGLLGGGALLLGRLLGGGLLVGRGQRRGRRRLLGRVGGGGRGRLGVVVTRQRADPEEPADADDGHTEDDRQRDEGGVALLLRTLARGAAGTVGPAGSARSTLSVLATGPTLSVLATGPTLSVLATGPTLSVLATGPTLSVLATGPTLSVLATGPTLSVLATRTAGLEARARGVPGSPAGARGGAGRHTLAGAVARTLRLRSRHLHGGSRSDAARAGCVGRRLRVLGALPVQRSGCAGSAVGGLGRTRHGLLRPRRSVPVADLLLVIGVGVPARRNTHGRRLIGNRPPEGRQPPGLRGSCSPW